MTPLPSFPHPPQSLSSEIRIGSLNLNVWQQIIINLYIYICRCVYVYVPSNQEVLVMSGMQLRLIRDIEGGDTGGAIGHHALCSNHYSTLKGHYLHRHRGGIPTGKAKPLHHMVFDSPFCCHNHGSQQPPAIL